MKKYIDQFSRKYTIKITTLLVVLFYFLVPVSLSHHLMDMNMDMGMHSIMSMDHNCTHLTGENSLCDINIFNHMTMWKSVSMSVSIVIRIVLPVSIIFLILVSVDSMIDRLFLYLKRKRFRYILVLYNDLFSSGILNGKAF